MTVVYCSAKLAKLLGVKSRFDQTQFSSLTNLGSWNAHLFYFAGKKFIIFMNKKCIYAVIISHYKKTDLLTLKLLFIKALKEQCSWDGIEITEQQLRTHFTDVVFSTTDNDKSAIGSMNDLVYHAQVSLDAGPPAMGYTQDETMVFNMNQMPCGRINYARPNKAFETILHAL